MNVKQRLFYIQRDVVGVEGVEELFNCDSSFFCSLEAL